MANKEMAYFRSIGRSGWREGSGSLSSRGGSKQQKQTRKLYALLSYSLPGTYYIHPLYLRAEGGGYLTSPVPLSRYVLFAIPFPLLLPHYYCVWLLLLTSLLRMILPATETVYYYCACILQHRHKGRHGTRETHGETDGKA
ncbi:hypothetical protein GGS26DRAFT_548335 [Hypomontagnella submonticulosa]|nr:hypothetical protein GGS26DRAFT_548335 [Hypomontagnella submonticulosa]